MLAVAQFEHRQYFPRPGWVEHDAEEIWRNVTRVVPAALRSGGMGPENIVALGIANQRETTVVWDRHTGTPLARAITWQDTRTDGIVARLVGDGSAALVTQRCGLPPATYFAGPRLAGCSTTSRGPAREPRRATCCSARWRAGWCGT
jgi:glycerol kinase